MVLPGQEENAEAFLFFLGILFLLHLFHCSNENMKDGDGKLRERWRGILQST